jgi:hypothetical protein
MFRRQFAFMGLVGLLICAGCIEGHVRTFLKYESNDDSFRCLQTFSNINASGADVDHLESLWQRRESIILNPFQINLFGMTAIERKGRYQYSVISLGSSSATPPEVTTTSVDLDTIRLIPGEFYLNEHRNLCYHHQVVVPGKTADAILRELTPQLAKAIAEMAESQLQLVGKDKVRKQTWDEVRKLILKDMFSDEVEKPTETPETEKPEVGEWMAPWEVASLRMLAKAPTDKSLKIDRAREIFTIVVPLSKRDCNEVMATADFMRDVVAERLKAGKKVEEGIPEFLESFNLKHLAETGLEITIDFKKLAKTVRSEDKSEPTEKLKLAYKSTVASIQGRGVPINRRFSIEDLLGEYARK